MFSNNPRADLFKLNLPDSFFIPEITDKYNEYLSQFPRVLGSIEAVINESIQSFISPEFGYTAIEQQSNIQGGAITNYTASKLNEQQLAEKTLQIVFRHTEAYLTYWCMMEHFFHRYRIGEQSARKPWGDLILITTLDDGIPLCKIIFQNVLFNGIDNLNLSFNSLISQFDTFTCTFTYSTLQNSIIIPELKLS